MATLTTLATLVILGYIIYDITRKGLRVGVVVGGIVVGGLALAFLTIPGFSGAVAGAMASIFTTALDWIVQIFNTSGAGTA